MIDMISVEAEQQLKPTFEKFKEEMRKRGFSEVMIEKAIQRAKNYVATVSAYLDSANPELMKKAQVEMMPEALEHSRRWLVAMKEAFWGG